MIDFTVCIDAGHNFSGWNTGAVGVGGIREQDITWEIAERLRVRLERKGVKVIMTRLTKETNLGTDNNSSLERRCDIANISECGLFVSLHCNAGGGTGTETLVYNLKSEAVNLAKIIQSEITNKLEMSNRGVKARPELKVLRKTEMPAVLVEMGFIDNTDDIDKLVNSQEDFSKAICDAICEYKGIAVQRETAREKAERIICERCDSPEQWLTLCDTVPWFSEFVCKIRG